ncbi:putative hybrid NRPS/PKS enzyme [Coniella lustricola]|uniref:Putative hybrid NRPS/PKS enzyme n=1 Tax=Coniella lustricola TaxID=2025994 RepID=A0A2T2ZXL2_9PEZI|nr:putative hybrid NRPS/PKS enzyme [Coniella lustricola]
MAQQRFQQTQPEPIAVVGSACRFPGGSHSPSALWDLLRDPHDVSSEIADERFRLSGFYHPVGAHHGTTNVQRAYMLQEDVRMFDAGFFNISPNEADATDPQQRLLLEVVYEALEAGGHAMERLCGSDTAVYVGTMSVDYNDMILRDIQTTPTYFSTGTSRAILANRVSYVFDWHGPSMTIDTACSSSMVALHQSVQSLRASESRVAIASGTELLLGPDQFVGESKMGLLSPTGQSRMWDANANGYARGDGVAAVVLKRLSDAIADGDQIECLIRETGVNQDGHSNGITVPSAEAQAALIQSTYARAGLDLANPHDWPQFFEAHGTGTKAGDPREARAISQCFGGTEPQAKNSHPLYVGSIKTIIGHTEGTAGLAGVLKACQSIRHGLIPPNLLLHQLNPEVAQYCQNLKVLTSLTPWPALPDGVPRRASVNSFGFGGTNGHAIIESYDGPSGKGSQELIASSSLAANAATFVFSAASDSALAQLLQSYSDYLKAHDTVAPADLAWTLQSRRSALRIKTALSARTVQSLCAKIDQKLDQAKAKPGGTSIGIRSVAATRPRIMGVFTGQGAQWATMGAQLIQTSAAVRAEFQQLDADLATLPEAADRPAWTIADQLCAAKDVSCLGEAALSQPLCTAVQIVLVDLLREAGVTFSAVVGHSSGEIAAAYAAGMLSARDAIRIAYFRGVHARRAVGGAMLAVGTSLEDAQELLALPAFRGRLQLAAHNSDASLTLSGDADAVAHAKRVFDEEKKFARLLLVDTAYHSHHMHVCSEPYVASLRRCDIQQQSSTTGPCQWFSSVRSGDRMASTDESLLDGTYWRDNMVQSVLFADAVRSAVANVECHLVIEVGPHPALKGPAQQTISSIVSSPLPYTGVLSRGQADDEAFADALGFIWTHLGPDAVHFAHSADAPPPKLLTGLPSYPWDHSKAYWHESRKSRKTRVRSAAFHELLGVPSPDNTARNMRWSNMLRSDDIPWLDGHQLQGQTVFPAAGYVAMALEGAKTLAGDRSVQVLQVENLVIARAIAFDQVANFAVETLMTLTSSVGPGSAAAAASMQTADFAVYACANNTGSHGELELVANGQVMVIYGEPSPSTLTATAARTSDCFDDASMVDVDREDLYSTLHELGYGYNGPFRTLSQTRRKLGYASATVSTYDHQAREQGEPLLVHPAMLDVAFQACFLAHTSPGDEHLWSLHVPTSIRCIRVNPALCASLPMSAVPLPVSAVLHPDQHQGMRGSVDVMSEDGHSTMLQVQDLVMKPFSPAQAANDRPMFSTLRYGPASPSGNSAAALATSAPSPAEIDLGLVCERVAYHYLSKWAAADQTAGQSEEQTGDSLAVALARKTAAELLAQVDQGQYAWVDKDKWAADDDAIIAALVKSSPGNADLQLLAAIGEAKGITSSQDSNLVDDVYSNGLGFATANACLGQMLQQILFRYPHANILELGTTDRVLQSLGSTLGSYLCAESSDQAVSVAAKRLRESGLEQDGKDSCAKLDVNAMQGRDVVVVASKALYVNGSPQQILENARRLLRPGGYIVLVVPRHTAQPLRTHLLGAAVAGQSKAELSQYGMAAWNSALRKAGFSGIDTATPPVDSITRPFTVVAAQALDSRVEFLRAPCQQHQQLERFGELVILGNQTIKTWHLVDEIMTSAQSAFAKVTIMDALPTEDDDRDDSSHQDDQRPTTFINLLDLDAPIWDQYTEARLQGLKTLFDQADNLIWVTQGGREGDEPFHTASIAFSRCIASEMPHLSLQVLDLDMVHDDAAVAQRGRLIAEAALRLAAFRHWEDQETTKDLLWSREPELYVQKDRLLVARLLPDHERNARLNSLRRSVSKTVDPRRSTVEISSNSLVEEELPSSSSPCLQVAYATRFALAVASEAFLFLCLGSDLTTGDTAVVLSDTNASRIAESHAIAKLDVQVPANQTPSAYLAAIASELVASMVLDSIPAGSHLLVHEPGRPGPDNLLVTALVQRAIAQRVSILFSTSSPSSSSSAEDWLHWGPWTSAHDVRTRVPVGLTHFCDLTANAQDEISLLLRANLPSACQTMTSASIFQLQASKPSPSGVRAGVDALCDALRRVQAIPATTMPAEASGRIETVRPNDLGPALSSTATTLVDWAAELSLAVPVQPIDASRLFSQNKTYLLVGLSGQLGRSICEWMARNGAGCICLTSRNPPTDQQAWQASIARSSGTTVNFYGMDVTDKADLARVVDEIRASCPPIAGVANGAALFRDTLFNDMTLERMQQSTRPKIQGTRYLDELLSSEPLDFFLVFSSLMTVLGNPSQTNYVIGNAYMTGLMAHRRRRGLAGTSLEIGRVAGIGYVERAGDVARQQLIRMGCMAICESELHQLLAEAIVSGGGDQSDGPSSFSFSSFSSSCSSSSSTHVLTTGCSNAREDDEPRVPWFDNPLFSHKVALESRTPAEDGAGGAGGSKKSNLPVRQRLADATTSQEALAILKESFAAKVAIISRLDGPVGESVPLIELGIDSLVAVEVRGWFLKELKTDVPVLKVLGGGSVADLCQFVLEKLPASLLPSLGNAGKAAQPSKAEAGKAKPARLSPRPAKPLKASTRSQSPPSPSSSDESPSAEMPGTPMTEASSHTDGQDKETQEARLEAYTKKEPISFQQARFWYLEKLIEDPTTFNVSFYWRITGSIRIGALERAVQMVVKRHESLRTVFLTEAEEDGSESGSTQQAVLGRDSSLVRLEHKKIEKLQDVQAEYNAMKVIPFDLASGRLLRMILLTLSPTQHFLLFNYHHILLDGVSFQNFMLDLDKAYQRQPLGPAPAQMTDVARRQHAALDKGTFDDDIAWWRRALPSNPPVLPLLPPARVRVRTPVRSYHVHQVEGRLSAEALATVRRVGREFRATAFHVYLAVFKTMLFRFAADDDFQALTIGVADANRGEPDTPGTVELLLNLLTLYFERDGGTGSSGKHQQTFGEAVAEARTKAYAALAHSRVPFDVLLKELNIGRSATHSPFFQAFMDYWQGTQESMPFGGALMELQELHPGRTAYDMTLDITDGPDGAIVLLRTQAALYDRTSAQLFLDTYLHLLEVLTSDPSLHLADAPLFSHAQLATGIEAGRGPSMLESSWVGGTLPHRIDQVAAAHQDQVAVKDGHDSVLTYAGLQDRIEAIAEAMLAPEIGVRQGDRVLVFQDASSDWPCSMLAIMRLGAVYVPLDLRNPLPRLADVAASCQPAAVLVDNTTAKDAPQLVAKCLATTDGRQVRVLNVSQISAQPSASRIDNKARPENVAAILYTSGSTGQPKGIVVKHSGLRNEIEGYTKQWGLGPERVLQQSAFTFNHSSDQMYTGLVNGGSVYIVPWSKRGDPVEVTALLRDEAITYTKATPAEYLLWLEYGHANLEQASSWRFAFGGGEPLTDLILHKLAALNLRGLRFFNSYGPTEISISSTKMEVDYRKPPPPEGSGRIPCGFSLPNYAAYILDEQRQPLPVGMPGKLWIGGAGVSLGYLDNEKLTQELFATDPFATPDYVSRGWTRMYDTGDIAHLEHNGAMVFHSRVAGDTQVKIRGLRIELADIESNLMAAAGGALSEAVVTLRENDLLVAHVVLSPNAPPQDPEAFLESLLQSLPLPQYMVPVVAIPLERMPLNNHSKTDRRALKQLPPPTRSQKAQPVELGDGNDGDGDDRLTETMLQLRQVWEGLLSINELGLAIKPSTSFFSVGGNSLLAVRLQARIRRVFSVAVRLLELLEANTLAEMAQLIEKKATAAQIDWETETALPAQLLPTSATPLKTANKVILVTGAGGFLGKHVLQQLLCDPAVAKVVCIGVRDKSTAPRRFQLPDDLVESPKLVTFAGDLTSNETLGLSPADFASLAEEADAILHMAAARAFWDNYHVLRASNVEPTRALVRLASARRIPIHYVSTAGVVPIGDGAAAAAASVAANPPGHNGADGYVATRWASEQILERAATSSTLALPVTIHRFMPPTCASSDAAVRAALDHIVGFVDKVGAVPDCAGVTGQFDMMLVHEAADCLAAPLVVPPGAGGAQFRAHYCPAHIDIAQLTAAVEARSGDFAEPVKNNPMPLLKFFGRMKALGLGYFVASQNLTFASQDQKSAGELKSRR